MIKIIKNNGEGEPFDPEKLKASLLRARVNLITANDIVSEINKNLKTGSTTNEIYKQAFSLLKKKEKRSAVMYSLRRSILNLGPSGFPFENYISEIMQAKGYKTMRNQTLQGKCIEHETDVIAYDDKDYIIMEVKFHNKLGIKSDTKVALYIKARFDDLRASSFLVSGKKRKMTRGVLITNTKFTSSVKRYAKCVNEFDLISWDYPEKGNLYDLIFETGLHPTTCIPILSNNEKKHLIEKGLVNCRSLKDNSHIMKEVGISDEKIKKVVDNIDLICSDAHSYV